MPSIGLIALVVLIMAVSGLFWALWKHGCVQKESGQDAETASVQMVRPLVILSCANRIRCLVRIVHRLRRHIPRSMSCATRNRRKDKRVPRLVLALRYVEVKSPFLPRLRQSVCSSRSCPTVVRQLFIRVSEFPRECVARMVMGSETGAACTESRGCGVVMGPTGRSHPTVDVTH